MMTELDEWPDCIVASSFTDEMFSPGYVFLHADWENPLASVTVKQTVLARVLWMDDYQRIAVGYRCNDCRAIYFAAHQHDALLTRHDCGAERERRNA